jgi:hypothetical protein
MLGTVKAKGERFLLARSASGMARPLENVSYRQRRVAAERLDFWHPEELTAG